MTGAALIKLLDMVEKERGLDGVEETLIEACGDATRAYTAARAYDDAEYANLAAAAARVLGRTPADVQRAVGAQTFQRFLGAADQLLHGCDDALSVLAAWPQAARAWYTALHPNGVGPGLTAVRESADCVRLELRRSFEGHDDFLHGVISGCLEAFGEHATVALAQNGEMTTFVVTRDVAAAA